MHIRYQVDAEGVKQLFIMSFKGFPDWHEAIDDIIAEGDKVWVRLIYTGTHICEFFGLAPTGKKVTMTSNAIYRIVNGKLVDGRSSICRFLDYLILFNILHYS